MEPTNGNLANVPLGGAFCSTTFRRRSGGLNDVDLGGNKTSNQTKHANTYIFKKPNMHREKVPCREALELGGSPNYMIYSQILRNCLLAKLITILRTEYKVNIALHVLHGPLIKIN